MMTALVLTCALLVPSDACTLQTSLMAAPTAVEDWKCAPEALAERTHDQVGSSGTYDKIECRPVPVDNVDTRAREFKRWRPGQAP